MVDVEQFDLVEARLVQPFEVFGRKLVARLDIDFAGGLVDEIIGGIAAEDFLGRDQQFLQPVGLRLLAGARRHLLPQRKGDFRSDERCEGQGGASRWRYRWAAE